MNIIELLKNVYTNRKCDWIIGIDENEIQPYVIQRWFAMNDAIRVQTRWLDKYVFHLPPKMYLSLAWSIIPKTPKAPFTKYIKQLDNTSEYDFILERVRKQYKLSDNDFNSMKERIVNAIKADTVNWFKYYGIEKRYWKKYYLNFNKIKEDEKEQKKQTGLEAWGL